MALEMRNGRPYFYRTRRSCGRVVREYGASGEGAALCYQLTEYYRQDREFQAAKQRAEVEEIRGQNAALRDWFAAVDGVIATALELSGWHLVRRQWRKQRGATVGTLATVEQLTWVSPELAALAGDLDPDIREKADKGDRAAMKAVDDYFANPAALALWGDLGRYVFKKWVAKLSGDSEVVKLAITRFASDLRTRLAGPNPSALDTLLAERVVLAWMNVHWAELQYAGQTGEQTYQAAEFQMKRVDLANRLLLSACRALAKVKKSKLPDVLALVNVSPARGGGMASIAGEIDRATVT